MQRLCIVNLLLLDRGLPSQFAKPLNGDIVAHRSRRVDSNKVMKPLHYCYVLASPWLQAVRCFSWYRFVNGALCLTINDP